MEPITTSINAAGQAIGVGRTRIYELINEGHLKTVKIGRRRLVRVDSLRALVADAA